MTSGTVGSPDDPDVRTALAAGLARHIEFLGRFPVFASSAGRGSAWCRYQDGPWPTPHDPIFDFRERHPEHAWLDEIADAAAGRLRAYPGHDRAAGHDDWCLGNVRFDGTRLVASFDWNLVAAPDAFIAGFAAAGYTDDSTGTAAAPSPDQVGAFLDAYSRERRGGFDATQQRAAAAAAVWVLAYNARCQLSTAHPATVDPGSPLGRLRDHAREYLQLQW